MFKSNYAHYRMDITRMVKCSNSWSTFEIPQALFPDIYRESALPKKDPELKPRDQSVLLLC